MLKDCDPKKLEKLLKDHPLTKGDAKEIMANSIGEIKATNALLRTSIFYNKKSGKYDLAFSQNDLEKDQKENAQSLIHKLYHIYCGVSSVMNNELTMQKSMKLEGMMDRAAKDFYDKNKEFSENLYKEIYEKYLKKEKTA